MQKVLISSFSWICNWGVGLFPFTPALVSILKELETWMRIVSHLGCERAICSFVSNWRIGALLLNPLRQIHFLQNFHEPYFHFWTDDTLERRAIGSSKPMRSTAKHTIPPFLHFLPPSVFYAVTKHTCPSIDSLSMRKGGEEGERELTLPRKHVRTKYFYLWFI